MTPPRRRALVIHNPTAGRRRRALLEAVLRDLERAGVVCDLRPTTGPGDATAIAATAARDRHDAVIAAGGDGTVNEVARGLLDAADPPPLAIVPLGTANVLARELALPPTCEGLAALIALGPAMDLRPSLVDGRPVLLMAGAGFDAAVVHAVGRRLKRWLGKGAYLWRTLTQLVRPPLPPLRVEADGAVHAARAVVLCKSRHYGGPFIAAPAADPRAATVEVCLFQRAGARAQLRYGLALLGGRLDRLPDVQILRAARVRVTAEGGGAVPVQVDGDAAGALPLVLEPGPRPLTVLAPQPPPMPSTTLPVPSQVGQSAPSRVPLPAQSGQSASPAPRLPGGASLPGASSTGRS